MSLTEQRTQIYLPADLHEQARRLSHRNYDNDPVWKLIRNLRSKFQGQ